MPTAAVVSPEIIREAKESEEARRRYEEAQKEAAEWETARTWIRLGKPLYAVEQGTSLWQKNVKLAGSSREKRDL